MGKAWDSYELAGPGKWFLTFADAAGLVFGFWILLCAEFRKQFRHFWNNGDISAFSLVGSSLPLRICYTDDSSLEVYIRPRYGPRFGQPASREGKKPHEVGAILGLPCASGFDLFQDGSELVWLGQHQAMSRNADSLDLAHGIVRTRESAQVQNCSKSPERVIEILRIECRG